jgi:hypothetical protein
MSTADQLYYDACEYRRNGDSAKMVACLLKAIDLGHALSMDSLASHYKSVCNYDNTIKYYTMAIEAGCNTSIFNLALYYEHIGDTNNMFKYYLLGCENLNGRLGDNCINMINWIAINRIDIVFDNNAVEDIIKYLAPQNKEKVLMYL